MKIVAVIESRRYRNIINNRTASIYGAAPWYSESEKANWIVETVGFTWELDNGTIGLGRVPAKTREEAEVVMDKFNNR